MPERQFEPEASIAPESVQNMEEQLPASLAIKSAIRMAFEHRVPGDEVRGHGYETADKRNAIIVHGTDSYTVAFTSEGFAGGGEDDSELERSQYSYSYRLTGEDDDLDLIKVSWPGKTDDDEPQEVNQAEAKRLLTHLAQLKESGSATRAGEQPEI
jgi:hypothetical protein